ncbi:hypothetical protein T4A_11268 [Trichinella pseudospiralis]|uniref:Uncharacterized protein n=1 Tax=Trichinella pseudospiralis TaxID=6337 RepID=A0A0V1F461_TRIPS|nr:hypothetical protein T4A_11268 [Trichinella pseudospiralis]
MGKVEKLIQLASCCVEEKTKEKNDSTAPPPVEPIYKEEPKPNVDVEVQQKLEKVPRSEDYDTINSNLSNVFDNFKLLQAQPKDAGDIKPPVAGPEPGPGSPGAAAVVADPKNKAGGHAGSKDPQDDYITVQTGNTVAFFIPKDKSPAGGATKVEEGKNAAATNESDLKFKSALERTAIEYLQSKR